MDHNNRCETCTLFMVFNVIYYLDSLIARKNKIYVIVYYVQMLMFYSIQTTNLILVGKNYICNKDYKVL